MVTIKRLTMLAVPWVLLGSSALALTPAGPSVNITPDIATRSNVPRMSWDGKWVTFQTMTGFWDGSDAAENIYLASTDGTVRKQITWTLGDASNAKSEVWATPSPDGSKVIFYYWYPPAQLIMVDVATGKATQITTDNSHNAFQQYSPDGSKIVFMSSRPGVNYNYSLWVMKPEPESATNVPIKLSDQIGVGRPSFTPDGQYVLYSFQNNIWRVSAAGGGTPVQVTTVPTGKSPQDPIQPVAGGPIFFYMVAQDGNNHIFRVDPDGSNLHQVTGADYSEAYCSASPTALVTLAYDYATNGYNNQTVAVYPLTNATGDGTVSGNVINEGNKPLVNGTVDIYDGFTKVQTVKTDAGGNYTATLPAGGYCLQYYGTAADGTTANTVKVWRGIVVPPNGTVVKNAFTTPLASQRPVNVIPTIKYANVEIPDPDPATAKVSVRWGPGNAPSAGYTVQGYNVYKGASATGPWTKIGDVGPNGPYEFVDQAPGNLGSAFYTVSTVTADASNNKVESAYADSGQAANNLVYNGSFENGLAGFDTWSANQWLWGGVDGGVGYANNNTEKVDGAQSAQLTLTDAFAGAGSYYLGVDWSHKPGIKGGDQFVYGLYAKSPQNPMGTAYLHQGYDIDDVFVNWYRATDNSTEAKALAGIDPPKLTDNATTQNPNWTYLSRRLNTRTYEFADHTSLALVFTPDAGAFSGTKVLFDELRYQAKNYGATGTISGRIQQRSANPVHCQVSANGKTVWTDNYRGNFVLTDIPTGPVELTITNMGIRDAGQPAEVKITVPNYGGYNLQRDYTFWDNTGLPLKLSGHVRMWDGSPVAGATVTAANPDWLDRTATTDATGYYEFTEDFGSWNYTTVTAEKLPLGKVVESVGLGLAGNTVLDLELPPSYPFQIARATTAPTINGIISPNEWSRSQVIPLPYSGDPIQFPRWPSEAYALWDNDNLYLAFKGVEPNPAGMGARADAANPGLLWTWTGGAGDNPWNGDDIFAFWLNPGGAGGASSGGDYWQILGNSADFGYQIRWPNWAGFQLSTIEVKAKVDNAGGYWTQEWKIPYLDLASADLFVQTPTPGDKWLINLQRNRHQPEPAGEGSGINWSLATFVENVTPPMKGDLNNDGQVTAADGILAIRVICGFDPIGARMGVADIDGNGQVVTDDACRIIRKANGLGNF